MGDADAAHNSLPARFAACRSAYWTAAITATDISKLLGRIEVSPDVAGRDVDAAYREAVDHHRSVLAEISARIARLRVEEELGRSQSG